VDETDATKRHDDHLLSPFERTAVLEKEIGKLAAQGFQIDSRVDHHVVMVEPDAGRRKVSIFIDEFGLAHRG